jgi:hypothetical protein
MSSMTTEFEKNLKLILHGKLFDLEKYIVSMIEELEFLKAYLRKFHETPEMFDQPTNTRSFLLEINKEMVLLKESIDRIQNAPIEDTLPLIRYTGFGDPGYMTFNS